jgi:hypothetical protein
MEPAAIGLTSSNFKAVADELPPYPTGDRVQ